MTKFQDIFLWEGANGSRRMHLINWSTVTLPKSQGGLGIPKALYRNVALLTSLSRRYFIPHKDSRWTRLLKFKYLKIDTFPVFLNPKYHHYFIWKSIGKGFNILRSHIIHKIGNGQLTNFYYHSWLCNRPLWSLLYSPLTKQEETLIVAQVLYPLSHLSANNC